MKLYGSILFIIGSFLANSIQCAEHPSSPKKLFSPSELQLMQMRSELERQRLKSEIFENSLEKKKALIKETNMILSRTQKENRQLRQENERLLQENTEHKTKTSQLLETMHTQVETIQKLKTDLNQIKQAWENLS